MKFESIYTIGNIVYLKTDREQLERIITAVCFRSTGIIYNIANGTTDTWHYECEVSDIRDIVKATTG